MESRHNVSQLMSRLYPSQMLQLGVCKTSMVTRHETGPPRPHPMTRDPSYLGGGSQEVIGISTAERILGWAHHTLAESKE
jgi:hypothetical protein